LTVAVRLSLVVGASIHNRGLPASSILSAAGVPIGTGRQHLVGEGMVYRADQGAGQSIGNGAAVNSRVRKHARS